MKKNYFKIGFHGGPGGNHNGIGDYYQTVNNAGRPIMMKSIEHAGHIYEAQQFNNPDDVLLYRLHKDLPDYKYSPKESAKRYWSDYKSKLPAELDYSRVILGILNEPAKWFGGPHQDDVRPYEEHRQPMRWNENTREWVVDNCEWLAEFCLEISIHMVSDGYKGSFLGWSSGEPEPFQWEGEKMLEFLQKASQYPDEIFIDLHEYSYTTDYLYRPENLSLVGRFTKIFEVCDRYSIPRPSIVISEFGWTHRDAPNPEVAMEHIKKASEFYAQYPEVKGLYLWCLNDWIGKINNDIQRLIKPVANFASKIEYPTIKTKKSEQIVLKELSRISNSDTASNDHFPMLTYWPTDVKYITQAFGQNPSWYKHEGLLGHNGVDISAPEGSIIRAAIGGEVIWASDINLSGKPSGYGYHIRIKTDNLILIYAHLKKPLALKVGEMIDAGQEIGRSGSGHETATETSTGPHLHFEGRMADGKGLDGWPWGIIDVSPLLYKLHPTRELLIPYANDVPGIKPYMDIPFPVGMKSFEGTRQLFRSNLKRHSYARLGVHLSADGKDFENDRERLKLMKPDIIKTLSSHRPKDLRAIAAQHIGAIWVIRAFLDFWDSIEQVGRHISAKKFVEGTISDVARTVKALTSNGVREEDIYIEIHNEPNLVTEGLGSSWTDGKDFGKWFEKVLKLYKKHLPHIKMGFPGLSPGHVSSERPIDHVTFLSQAQPFLSKADWLGVHAYWSSTSPMDTEEDSSNGIGVVKHASTFKLPIIVTEASNNQPDSEQNKAEQYIKFARLLNFYPDIIGVTYFVLSASHQSWGWGFGKSAETFTTTMAEIVGKREKQWSRVDEETWFDPEFLE